MADISQAVSACEINTQYGSDVRAYLHIKWGKRRGILRCMLMPSEYHPSQTQYKYAHIRHNITSQV